MGCCQSTDAWPHPSDQDSPSRIGAPSALPATATSNRRNDPSSHPSIAGRNRSRNRSRGESTTQSAPVRPNQPVRAPSPLRTSPKHLVNHPPPWSRSLLEKERIDFFDTRVTGRREIWDALRLACDMVHRGDLPGAQGILDALNMTCPYGRVASGRGRRRDKGGIYDEFGELYDIPAWVIADPEDVVEDEEKDLDNDDEHETQQKSHEAESDDAGNSGAQRRDEKGKARAEDVGDLVTLRVRLSDRATDLTVQLGTKQKLEVATKDIEQRIGARVRLAYLGRMLNETANLEQCGWAEGHVMNAMVFNGDGERK